MREESKAPELGLGRFSDPSLVILTCLADGPKHGYAMIRESQDLGFPLGLGTLYGALNRLERLGMVEALTPEDRRRPYRLTDAGVSYLRGHLGRLNRVVARGWQKLGEAT